MTPKYFIYYNKNKKCNLALLLNNKCDSLVKVEDHGLFEGRPLTYKPVITKIVINKTLHFNFA